MILKDFIGIRFFFFCSPRANFSKKEKKNLANQLQPIVQQLIQIMFCWRRDREECEGAGQNEGNILTLDEKLATDQILIIFLLTERCKYTPAP